jgi:hypothetical protein
MNLATLRVRGSDDVLQALCTTLGLVPDSTWRKGDPKRRGGSFPTSGFSATIVDAKNPAGLVVAIRAFVARCQERNIVLSAPHFTAELSLGVTVGDSEQFVACVDFSASDLLSLGHLGVELSIAAYPTSDEANDEPSDA